MVAKLPTAKSHDTGKLSVISVRISASTKALLYEPRIGPYRVSITNLVERGIELALAELKALKNGK